MRNNNLIARFQNLPETIGNQIDSKGSSGSKKYFETVFGIDVFLDFYPCLFIRICCYLAEMMHATMNVCIDFAVIFCFSIYNYLRFLRCCSIVKYTKGLPLTCWSSMGKSLRIFCISKFILFTKFTTKVLI